LAKYHWNGGRREVDDVREVGDGREDVVGDEGLRAATT